MKNSVFYGIIYKYTNKVNGKIYIGQTVNEKSRKAEHRRAYLRDSVAFHNAIKKYGFSSFKYKVLFRVECSNKQDLINTLNVKEITAVKFYKSNDPKFGYNLTEGGAGRSGYHLSEDTKARLSILNKGKKLPPRRKDWCENISKAQKGKKRPPLSKSTIEKIRSKTVGQKRTSDQIARMRAGRKTPYRKDIPWLHTPEIWRKISESRKGMKFSLSHRKNLSKAHIGNIPNTAKEVNMYSLDGKYIKTFISAQEAGRYVNCSGSLIVSCCNYKIFSGFGYMWRYCSDKFQRGVDIEKYSLPENTHYKKVEKLSSSGEVLEVFESAQAASYSINRGRTYFNTALSKFDIVEEAGYFWRYVGTHSLPKEVRNTHDGCRKVSKFSLDGELIDTYPSLLAAAKSVGYKTNMSIYVSCTTNLKSPSTHESAGFMWFYSDSIEGVKVPKYTKKPRKDSVKVIKMDLEGNIVEVYNSCAIAAEKNGVTKSLIPGRCNKSYPLPAKWRGFLWKLSEYKNRKDDK